MASSPLPPPYATPRILSVQSWVVHGFVGNKVAVLPLQLLGFNVDPINSVQFCNHSGYARFTGQRMQGDDLRCLVDGLTHNRLMQYDFVLTGYAGSVSFLSAVLDLLDLVKSHNQDVIYVCDPVLGDNGALYVPETFVEIFRNRVVPRADVLLPNQTEAEFLTDMKITSLDSGFEACNCLHEMGVGIAVITSLQLEQNKIHCIASSTGSVSFKGSNESNRMKPERVCFYVDQQPGQYSGTGDLMAALLLGWLHRDGNLATAIEKSLQSIQAVLRRTRLAGSKELLVVESIDDIRKPSRLPAPHRVSLGSQPKL